MKPINENVKSESEQEIETQGFKLEKIINSGICLNVYWRYPIDAVKSLIESTPDDGLLLNPFEKSQYAHIP